MKLNEVLQYIALKSQIRATVEKSEAGRIENRIAIFNEKAVAMIFSKGATDAEENRKRKPDP